MINSYVSLPDGTNSSILASYSCEHISGRGSALRPGRPSPGRHAGAAKTQGKVSDKRFGLHHHQNTIPSKYHGSKPAVPGTIGTIGTISLFECVCPWYCFVHVAPGVFHEIINLEEAAWKFFFAGLSMFPSYCVWISPIDMAGCELKPSSTIVHFSVLSTIWQQNIAKENGISTVNL